MKRASRHRRRHAPPGPCGVLFAMSKKQNKHNNNNIREEEEELTEKDRSSTRSLLFDDQKDSGEDPSNTENGGDDHDDTAPSAWNSMLRSLNIPTPYIPISTRGNIPKRYELLRPHLPPNCILLQEILKGNHDLFRNSRDDDSYLCAWVETVEERNSHHGIWTVGLKDETGARIRAWMEPNFVREELQKTAEDASLGVVRVGVVWMLSDFSMIVVQNNSNGSSNTTTTNNNNSGGSIERMLVVSGKRIVRVWTPESDRAQNQPNEEEDSPEKQKDYLDWMAKRNALTMDEHFCGNNHALPPGNEEEERLGEEEEEEEEEREERWHRNHSHKRIVGGKEEEVRMTEMSALTMTADDDNPMTGSQHETISNDKHEQKMKPKSPLADRNVNRTSSHSNWGTTKNSTSFIKDEIMAQDKTHGEQSSILLQTQESTRGGVQEIDAKLLDEERQNEIPSSQGMVPRPAARKRKKHSKPIDFTTTTTTTTTTSPMRTRTPNRNSPKKSKTKSPKRKSPIRMSQTIWNTPDPSLLQMLEDDSEASAEEMEEEEIPTVIDEGQSLSFTATQFSSKPQNGNTEASSTTKLPKEQNSDREIHDDLVLPPTGRALLGRNLFEPSNFKGMDLTAFSESDSE